MDQPIPTGFTVTIKKLAKWQIFYALDMGVARAISYAIITQLLVRFVDEPTELLGGM